jgi:hypothetical protein
MDTGLTRDHAWLLVILAIVLFGGFAGIFAWIGWDGTWPSGWFDSRW